MKKNIIHLYLREKQTWLQPITLQRHKNLLTVITISFLQYRGWTGSTSYNIAATKENQTSSDRPSNRNWNYQKASGTWWFAENTICGGFCFLRHCRFKGNPPISSSWKTLSSSTEKYEEVNLIRLKNVEKAPDAGMLSHVRLTCMFSRQKRLERMPRPAPQYPRTATNFRICHT